jgi:hypothetical protein
MTWLNLISTTAQKLLNTLAGRKKRTEKLSAVGNAQALPPREFSDHFTGTA